MDKHSYPSVDGQKVTHRYKILFEIKYLKLTKFGLSPKFYLNFRGHKAENWGEIIGLKCTEIMG